MECYILKKLIIFALLLVFYGCSYAENVNINSSADLKTFPIGTPNTRACEHFTGESFLAPLILKPFGIFNVTFAPGSYNEWHIHHASKGGGQILIAVAGRGYYQEEGKPAQELKPGDVVNIPANLKHWHGAAKNSWFQHIAIEVTGEDTHTEWLGFLSKDDYEKLNSGQDVKNNSAKEPLIIREQGIFSAGGVVLKSEGEFDPVHGQFDPQGQTHHADHANVLYQIPENFNSNSIIFLHGYGQSRAGWISTPDGREGWSNIFLRKGYGVYLVDQPRRGEAGQTSKAAEISTLTQDQNWYTQFRIGLWPKTYDGSQFPDDYESLNQFFRQMTPNTGDFDIEIITNAFVKIFERAGNGILFTHSQGGIPGWEIAVKSEHVKAVVAIEPGGLFSFPEGEAPEPIKTLYAPVRVKEISKDDFAKLINQPIIIYFGDYIPDEPVELPARDYWRGVCAMANKFAECVNAHGGDCTVINLPAIGITGNEHFIFQDKNNDVVAEHIYNWLKSKGL